MRNNGCTNFDRRKILVSKKFEVRFTPPLNIYRQKLCKVISAYLKNSFLWSVDSGIRIPNSGFPRFRFRFSIFVFYGCLYVPPQAGDFHWFQDFCLYFHRMNPYLKHFSSKKYRIIVSFPWIAIQRKTTWSDSVRMHRNLWFVSITMHEPTRTVGSTTSPKYASAG